MRDFDRPLTADGRREATAAGGFLAENGMRPDRILCSSAKRTRETLEYAAASMPYLGPELGEATTFLDSLYNADSVGYLDIVRAAAEARTLLVIGHNPMTEDLARALAGSGDRTGMARLVAGFPTAGIAVLETDGDIARLMPGRARLAAFWAPR